MSCKDLDWKTNLHPIKPLEKKKEVVVDNPSFLKPN